MHNEVNAMSFDEKMKAIHSFQVCLQRSQKLEMILRFRKNTDKVKEIEEKNKNLTKKIDKLIIEIMIEWLMNAQETTINIKKINTNIERSITQIKKKKKEAENIVKAIGFIDDVINIASKLLPT
jgi:seryl-tRNA synthetase